MSDTPDFNDTPIDDRSRNKVANALMYGFTLPERVVKSGISVAGGTVKETARLLVPQSFRDSTTYTVLVERSLDLLLTRVAGVESTDAEGDDQGVEYFVARKAAGNFIEMAGLATIHLSPLTVLAIFSDSAYGSKAFLSEYAEELKREGLIDENSTINNIDDFIEAIASTSNTFALSLDRPPMDVEGMKETVAKIQKAVSKINPTDILPQHELRSLWKEMITLARKEDVSIVELSGAMTMHSLSKLRTVSRGALSTTRVTGTLIDRHLIGHYRSSIQEIGEKGIYATVAACSKPYIAAVYKNFSGGQSTITEDIFTGKLLGSALRKVTGLFGQAESSQAQPSTKDTPVVEPQTEEIVYEHRVTEAPIEEITIQPYTPDSSILEIEPIAPIEPIAFDDPTKDLVIEEVPITDHEIDKIDPIQD